MGMVIGLDLWTFTNSCEPDMGPSTGLVWNGEDEGREKGGGTRGGLDGWWRGDEVEEEGRRDGPRGSRGGLAAWWKGEVDRARWCNEGLELTGWWKEEVELAGWWKGEVEGETRALPLRE